MITRAVSTPGVAPQLSALQSNTQLVTMTIGGNDSSVFIDSILECGAAGLSTLGQGSPCKDKYGSSFDDTIRSTTYPALVTALKAVRAKAPHARVAILGYPWILPATGGCFPQMPVASGDVPYLRNEQATLNDAVRRAAAATGVTYVDMSKVSNGHDACQPIGVRWIEPVLFGTNPVIVHPNPLGEQQMAAQTLKVLHLTDGIRRATPKPHPGGGWGLAKLLFSYVRELLVVERVLRQLLVGGEALRRRVDPRRVAGRVPVDQRLDGRECLLVGRHRS